MSSLRMLNIHKLDLTRHALFPVSPGMCPHFYCGEYSVSIFNNTSKQTEKNVRKINWRASEASETLSGLFN